VRYTSWPAHVPGLTRGLSPPSTFFAVGNEEDVDGRVKPGHDEKHDAWSQDVYRCLILRPSWT
jgi:hypothetical protein